MQMSGQISDELERGTVVSWNGKYAFARLDRNNTDVYLGALQLARANISRLEIGQRLCFEVRPPSDRPWAARIRLASEVPA
jgi:cold shock CspA family protein